MRTEKNIIIICLEFVAANVTHKTQVHLVVFEKKSIVLAIGIRIAPVTLLPARAGRMNGCIPSIVATRCYW